LLPSIDEFSYDEPAEREAELPSIAAFAYDEPALPTYEEPGARAGRRDRGRGAAVDRGVRVRRSG
jgi:hypothetical protein